MKRGLRHTYPSPAPLRPGVRVHRKIGRNEPCPCGSGKKFKRCCVDHPLYHRYEAKR